VTATITINRSDLNKVSLKEASFADLVKSKAIKIEGDQNAFTSFLGKIDSFNFWFNIVEP
jgi:alkyl sulfatase BDS1-like metallo-beta-lactamase superfamily hydrolase